MNARIGFSSLLSLLLVFSTAAGQAPPKQDPFEKHFGDMKKETIAQAIDNLGDFYDWIFARGPSSSELIGTESYREACLTPRLMRVQRLLAEIGDKQKADYVKVFNANLRNAMSGYSQARDEHIEQAKIGAHYSEPTSYHRKRAMATVAVYILAEWNDPNALPEFLTVLEQRDRIPANRLFLLYATHLIIESLPQERLTAKQLKIMEEYSRLASKIFPVTAKGVTTKAWTPGENERIIQLHIYPKLENLEQANAYKLTRESAEFERVVIDFLRAK